MERLNKADLEVKDAKGNTPLYYAVQYNNFETTELLLNLGADINSKNEQGNTPLHRAFINNTSNAIINLLLGGGANMEALNDLNQTPIFFAPGRLITQLGLSTCKASVVTYDDIANHSFDK